MADLPLGNPHAVPQNYFLGEKDSHDGAHWELLEEAFYAVQHGVIDPVVIAKPHRSGRCEGCDIYERTYKYINPKHR